MTIKQDAGLVWGGLTPGTATEGTRQLEGPLAECSPAVSPESSFSSFQSWKLSMGVKQSLEWEFCLPLYLTKIRTHHRWLWVLDLQRPQQLLYCQVRPSRPVSPP